MFYFATPHAKTGIKDYELDSEKLDRNDYFTKFLEKNGFRIFLPMRDADQTLSGKKLLDLELNVIKNCEGIIVVLSDTRGIYLEAGYAKALGKKVVGLEVTETREFSDWGKAFFDYIARDENDLLNYLKNNT
jgi:nucleoside 2-deoxyribosyltransferase